MSNGRRKRHTAEQIIKKLREADAMLAAGNIGYRIEFDEAQGAHINVFAGKQFGPHFMFPGNQPAVNAILRQVFES